MAVQNSMLSGHNFDKMMHGLHCFVASPDINYILIFHRINGDGAQNMIDIPAGHDAFRIFIEFFCRSTFSSFIMGAAKELSLNMVKQLRG